MQVELFPGTVAQRGEAQPFPPPLPPTPAIPAAFHRPSPPHRATPPLPLPPPPPLTRPATHHPERPNEPALPEILIVRADRPHFEGQGRFLVVASWLCGGEADERRGREGLLVLSCLRPRLYLALTTITTPPTTTPTSTTTMTRMTTHHQVLTQTNPISIRRFTVFVYLLGIEFLRRGVRCEGTGEAEGGGKAEGRRKAGR